MIHDTVLESIIHYGYYGLFVSLALGILGLPIPDEILMIFAGYLSAKGKLLYFPSLIVAFLGSSLGMSISFFIGNRLGYPFLKKYGKYLNISDSKLEKMGKWFSKRGKFAVTIGYFVPGVRQVTAYLSGISRWNFRTFSIYAFSGGFFWVWTFITLGYFFGDKWRYISKYLHHYFYLSTFLLLIIFVLIRIYKNKNNPNINDSNVEKE